MKSRIKPSLFPALCLCLCLASCDLDDILSTGSGNNTGLSTDEVIAGLKQALEIGTENAADTLHAPGGYFDNDWVRILLPEEVSTTLDYADQIAEEADNNLAFELAFISLETVYDFSLDDFRGLRQTLWESLNRAAEEAAPVSVGIFGDAIQAMTFADAWNILRGDSTAATDYFHLRTLDPLTTAYRPIVDSTLALVNAAQLWEEYSDYHNAFVELYNQNSAKFSGFMNVNSLDPVSTDLGEYTTQKALDGLFFMVGREEQKIREDPVARVTELLEKVFGEQDD